MNSGEDQLGVLAQLYSVPWLSFRSVLWERYQRGVKGYSVEEIMLEGGADIHPNAYGHLCEPRTPPPVLPAPFFSLHSSPFSSRPSRHHYLFLHSLLHSLPPLFASFS